MGFADRLIFITPAGTDPLVVEKTTVEGRQCPRCGGKTIQRYPIAYYQGPRMVEKCQDCFETLSLTRPGPTDAWPPFRPATYDWDVSPAEKASSGDHSS
jgi:hypothetical protein